jgi:streptogramin lyase
VNAGAKLALDDPWPASLVPVSLSRQRTNDVVWVSDFGAGSLPRFNPTTGQFSRVAGQQSDVRIRQLLGRPGEVLGADSAHDRLIRVTE